MQNSIKKFIDGPVIQQTSQTKFDKIKKPVIFICQDGQFNYTEASSYGYDKLTYYSFGVAGYPIISWKGKYGNRTFKDLQQSIYPTDYSNTKTTQGIIGTDYKVVSAEDMIFLTPIGFCAHVNVTERGVRFQVTEKSTVYVADPRKVNKIKMSKMEKGMLKLGPKGDGSYDNNNYKVKLSVYNSALNEGQTCKDYEKEGTSFGQCVEESIGDMFLDLYACLPPWFPNSGMLTCEQNKETNIPPKEHMENYRHDFVSFYYEMVLSKIKPCLPPCVTVNLDLIDVSYIQSVTNKATMRLDFENEVTVYTDVYAYDMFSLVVDLGSALGLWLGLSALSMLDTLVQMLSSMKSKSVMCTLC